MRVLIVSPGFNEAGRFKLLERIGEDATVTLITLEELVAPAFGAMAAPSSTRRVTVLPNQPWRIGRRHLHKPQWRAWRRARPDVIHIEYDPWTPEFWSAMLPLLVLHPRAAWLACTGYTDTRIEVTHNVPIDETVFHGRRESPDDACVRVGYVGSLLAHKGVEQLVRAVDEMRTGVGPQVRLELVGRHDDEYADRVLRHGWTTHLGQKANHELPDFLATLDVFVMPSLVLPDHEEHDGVALLEAMTMGLPVIGTRGGILREIIDDGENGLLVDPGGAHQLAARGVPVRRMSTPYRALTAYQDDDVVAEYERRRFGSR